MILVPATDEQARRELNEILQVCYPDVTNRIDGYDTPVNDLVAQHPLTQEGVRLAVMVLQEEAKSDYDMAKLCSESSDGTGYYTVKAERKSTVAEYLMSFVYPVAQRLEYDTADCMPFDELPQERQAAYRQYAYELAHMELPAPHYTLADLNAKNERGELIVPLWQQEKARKEQEKVVVAFAKLTNDLTAQARRIARQQPHIIEYQARVRHADHSGYRLSKSFYTEWHEAMEQATKDALRELKKAGKETKETKTTSTPADTTNTTNTADTTDTTHTTDTGNVVTVEASDLHDLARLTTFCAAKDDNRPLFRNVCLTFGDDYIEAATSDSWRIAVYRIPAQIPTDVRERRILVNAAALKTTVAKLSKRGTVTLAYTAINTKDYTGTLQIADHPVLMGMFGTYPRYEALMPRPQNDKPSITVNRLELLKACKSMKAMLSDLSSPPVTFTITDEELRIGASYDGKTQQTTLAAQGGNGHSGSAILNVKFLVAALQAATGNEITLELQGVRPSVIRDATAPAWTHVVMPMHETR